MQVNRVGTMAIALCRPRETVSAVAERMGRSGVGILPIVDLTGQTIGVVTERDIVTRCLGEGLDPAVTYAEEIMSRPVYWVYADTELEDAARVMATNRVRRLIVKDRREQLAGVLSIDDIALFTHGDATAGRILEQSAMEATASRNPDFYDAVL